MLEGFGKKIFGDSEEKKGNPEEITEEDAERLPDTSGEVPNVDSEAEDLGGPDDIEELPKAA